MKIEVAFRDDPTGFPGLESNFISDGTDGIRLLFMALISKESLENFSETVLKKKSDWDCDSFDLSVKNDAALIRPAYESDSNWVIPLQTLRAIASDWELFMSSRKPFRRQYSTNR